jgi:hypothetical protein
MDLVCKVKQCRYPKSHNTSSHLCGSCRRFGHGQIECNNDYLKDTLKQNTDFNKPLDIAYWCMIDGCINKHTHTTDSHHCIHCFGNHSHYYCSHFIKKQLIRQITCPICRKLNNIFDDTNPIVFGVDTKCSICLDNECNIIMPDCHHVCMCDTCYNILE